MVNCKERSARVVGRRTPLFLEKASFTTGRHRGTRGQISSMPRANPGISSGSHPVRALSYCGRLIRLAARQAALFAAGRPEKNWAQDRGHEARKYSRFFLEFLTQSANLIAAAAIHFPELAFHGPQCGAVDPTQTIHLVLEAFSTPRVGKIFVEPPSCAMGSRVAVKTEAVDHYMKQ